LGIAVVQRLQERESRRVTLPYEVATAVRGTRSSLFDGDSTQTDATRCERKISELFRLAGVEDDCTAQDTRTQQEIESGC
jgi:hypothetical protein